MFVLWAIPVGIAAGLLLGGRLEGLLGLRFRWAAFAVANVFSLSEASSSGST